MEKELVDAFEFERLRKKMRSNTGKEQSLQQLKELKAYLSVRKISGITGVPVKVLDRVLYGPAKGIKVRYAIAIDTFYNGLAATLKAISKKRKYLSKFK